MNKQKIGMYLVGGGIVLIGGYFIYKKIISDSAKKSVEGMIGGFGEKGLKLLGFGTGQAPLGDKKDAQQFNQAMRTESSPVPPHSPAKLPPKEGMGTLAKDNIMAASGKIPSFQDKAPKTTSQHLMFGGRGSKGIAGKPTTMAKMKVKAMPIARTTTPAQRARYATGGVASRAQSKQAPSKTPRRYF